MYCSYLDSFSDFKMPRHGSAASHGAPEMGAHGAGGKCVAGLEKPQEPVIYRQQGEKRQADNKNGVPIPRQVVTHAIGGLPIADIALQHGNGTRWLWHRKKSNASATVRTESGIAKRPS